MAGMIAHIQAPETLEKLHKFYENCKGTSLDVIFQDVKRHCTEWRVGKNSQKGDIIFFYCVRTAINKIKQAYSEAKEAGNSELMLHRKKGVIMTVEELKETVKQNCSVSST